jgi:hypothetical protein
MLLRCSEGLCARTKNMQQPWAGKVGDWLYTWLRQRHQWMEGGEGRRVESEHREKEGDRCSDELACEWDHRSDDDDVEARQAMSRHIHLRRLRVVCSRSWGGARSRILDVVDRGSGGRVDVRGTGRKGLLSTVGEERLGSR